MSMFILKKLLLIIVKKLLARSYVEKILALYDSIFFLL